MPHIPWPEDGCTLAEARERSADRAVWREWRSGIEHCNSLGPSPSYIDGYRLDEVHDDSRMRQRYRAAILEREKAINADFRRHMKTRRLIAYGRPNDLTAEPHLIISDIWPALVDTAWEQSAVGEGRRGGAVFRAVHVYPPLLAPCCAKLVTGHSLAEAFKKFVLEDLELEALVRDTSRQNQEFAEALNFDWRLPVDLASYSSFEDLFRKTHSFWEKFDFSRPNSRDACEVFWHRWGALLNLLKRGQLVARGTYSISGNFSEIDVNQWSREKIWIDVKNGDLLEEDNCKQVVRWSGIGLCDPVSIHVVSPQIAPSAVFHGKPTTSDHPRRSTMGRSDNPSVEKPTALQASIEQAVLSLWPNGIPEGLPVQTQNQRIIDWQKKNELAVASAKSIYRYLKGRSDLKAR